MTQTYETRDGIDVQIDVRPDTPGTWDRLPRPLLGDIDHLIATAASASPDWSLALRIGMTVITAIPATTEEHAA